MRFATTAVAALLTTVSVAAAQDSKAEKCSAIEHDQKRLACFDAAYPPPPQAGAAKKNDKPEDFATLKTRLLLAGWNLSQETSKIDDSTNVFLMRQASSSFRNRYGKEGRVTFIAACRENTTSLWLDFDGEFMSDLHHGTVTYRVDKRAAKRRRFRESNSHKALGLWSGGASIPFLKEVMAGETLVIRASPMSGSEIEAEFDMSKIGEALKPLRQECNW